jgi:RHS repeat-associated protein
VVDSFGFKSLAAYDPRYGHKTSTVDTNGNVVSYTYDVFGRQSSVTGPYEQGEGRATIEFAYHPEAAVPWALSRHNDKFRSATDTIDVVRFIDGLKRDLQLKTDAAVATSPGAAPADLRIVSGRANFDLVGRIAERYYATTEPLGDPGLFQTGYDSVTPTRTAYDVLDRTTRITVPDGAFGTYRYGFGPDRSGTTRFETLETDANGKEVRIYRNVRQEVAAVKELNTLSGGPLQPIWTTYLHDPLHQLVAVIDDQGNRTSVVYDNLGRRLSIDAPDAGKTEYVYDRASNLTAKITSNLKIAGQQIAYDYDFNRLLAIRYPAFAQNNVTYTYGAPGASNNRAGRIVTVTDESGREERSYGKLGEVTQETKTVATDTGGAPSSYVTQYLYDTFGRLQRLVYPDGEALTYLYDSGGRPRQVSGDKAGYHYEYVRSLQYDKFEQRAYLELGNGTRTTYAYRPDTRRLQQIRSTQSNGTLFQNLAYTYDAVGNVLGLDNVVAVPPASQYGGPTSQRFSYDDLYQLTSAEGFYEFAPNKTNRYALSLTYDALRNVRSKSQSHQIVEPSNTAVTQLKTTYAFGYAYDGPRPHAATHVGERTYTFDANGNQSGWTNDRNGTRRVIVWDEENRIQNVFDNGHEESYKYDYQGTRVIKRGPQGETAYVNQWFTIRNRTIGTKHVFVGPTRIASKLMKPPGVDSPNQTPLEKDRYFYHPDHVGSTGFVTDADGRLFEHLEYFPFGETWVEESSNTQRTPYLFTGKELDEETGLYAFGARYYDARLSQWTTNDPALDEYLTEEPAREGTDRDAAQIGPGAYFRLARLRGVYAPANLGLYGYAWQNPIVVHDPDGRKIVFAPGSSQKFKDEYARARKYLSKTKDFAILKRMEDSKETITLREGTKLTDTAYNPHSKELVWNPYSALITPGGGKQSPALGLLHELDHAEKHLKDPSKFNAIPYEQEELRVIKGSETRAARTLKEGTRTTPNSDKYHLYTVEHSDMR